MKLPPRLRLELRPSWIAAVLLTAACTMMSILLGLLPLPMPAICAGAIAVLTVYACGLRRCIGRGVPVLLQVGVDRRILVTDRKRCSYPGSIRDDSYVGAWLTTIVWCVDGAPWWRPAHTILVLPDTLPRNEFRRLRVVLRYGRPAGDEGSSEVEAG